MINIKEDGWLDNYLKFGFWQLLIMGGLSTLVYFGYSFVTNEWTSTLNHCITFLTNYSIEQRVFYLATMLVFGLGGFLRFNRDSF